MIELTAKETANLVVNFWAGDLIFKDFVQSQTVEKDLLVAKILKDKRKEKKLVKFFKALKKYVVKFLSKKSKYSDLLVFEVNPKPNNTLSWVASNSGLEIPALPSQHTLFLGKTFEESEGEKRLKVTLQGKQGCGALMGRQQFNLADKKVKSKRQKVKGKK